MGVFVFILRLSRELLLLKKEKRILAMYKHTAKLETTNFYRKLKKDQRELGKIKRIYTTVSSRIFMEHYEPSNQDIQIF